MAENSSSLETLVSVADPVEPQQRPRGRSSRSKASRSDLRADILQEQTQAPTPDLSNMEMLPEYKKSEEPTTPRSSQNPPREDGRFNRPCSILSTDEMGLDVGPPSLQPSSSGVSSKGAKAPPGALSSSDNAELKFSILKVPEYHRQPQEEFTPVGWSFGPNNKPELGADQIKMAIVRALPFEERGNWVKFCRTVVGYLPIMFQCYGSLVFLTDGHHQRLRRCLGTDALFLALFYDLKFPRSEMRLWTEELAQVLSSSSYRSRENMVRYDICKIENQVPFHIIKRAFFYMSPESSDNDIFTVGQDLSSYLQKWMEFAVRDGVGDFMDISGDPFKKSNPYPDLTNSNHILGAAYEVICGAGDVAKTKQCGHVIVKEAELKHVCGSCHNNIEKRRCGHVEGFVKRETCVHEGDERVVLSTAQVFRAEGYIHVPSASKLEGSGIKIEGVEGALCTMKYEGKVLQMPKMNLNDNTVAFIRNMALYEEFHTKDGCLFHDYVLMLDLFQTPEDLDILVKSGVIQNQIGGTTALQKWNALEHGLLLVKSSYDHNKMKLEINKRCAFRRYKFLSEFKNQYCSKPWIVLSLITFFFSYASDIASDICVRHWLQQNEA